MMTGLAMMGLLELKLMKVLACLKVYGKSFDSVNET
jgi:hypothetical protein